MKFIQAINKCILILSQLPLGVGGHPGVEHLCFLHLEFGRRCSAGPECRCRSVERVSRIRGPMKIGFERRLPKECPGCLTT